MRKLLGGLALVTTLALVPGFVSPAEARQDRGWQRGGYAGGHRGGYSAWDVVRGDPCRYDAFQRFAAKHENPNKRARFAERLAREGCDCERVAYDAPDYGAPAYAAPAYAPTYGGGYAVPSYDPIVSLVSLFLGR
jgi:hypothetical protein